MSDDHPPEYYEKLYKDEKPSLKTTMRVRVFQIKFFCNHIAKINSNKFDLKDTPDFNATKFGDQQFIFESVKKLFNIYTADEEVDVPLKWRELIEDLYLVSKIKSRINKAKSKIKKNKEI